MCVLWYTVPKIYNRATYINHLFPVMIDDLITQEWRGKAEPQTSYEMSSITSGNKWFIQCHSPLYVQFMQQQLMIKTPKIGAACILSVIYAHTLLTLFYTRLVLIGHEENDQGWNRNCGLIEKIYIYIFFWNLFLARFPPLFLFRIAFPFLARNM